jgi:hypothetical protein
MLVSTDDGDAFTLAQYRSWLLIAGFVNLRTVPAPVPSPDLDDKAVS